MTQISKPTQMLKYQVLLRSNGSLLPGLVLENPCAIKSSARATAEVLLKHLHRDYDQALIYAINEQGQPADMELTVLKAGADVRVQIMKESGD